MDLKVASFQRSLGLEPVEIWKKRMACVKLLQSFNSQYSIHGACKLKNYIYIYNFQQL